MDSCGARSTAGIAPTADCRFHSSEIRAREEDSPSDCQIARTSGAITACRKSVSDQTAEPECEFSLNSWVFSAASPEHPLRRRPDGRRITPQPGSWAKHRVPPPKTIQPHIGLVAWPRFGGRPIGILPGRKGCGAWNCVRDADTIRLFSCDVRGEFTGCERSQSCNQPPVVALLATTPRVPRV